MQPVDILVVEDDPHMADVLRQGFEQTGYTVALARDGGDGLRMAIDRPPRAIVLDVMLPVLDGFDVATELRRRGSTTPILMLTARAFEEDVIRGLDSGAEDYMSKPFSFRELAARVRVLLRRTQPQPTMLRVADLTIDTVTMRVFRTDIERQLSKTQFRLLQVLVQSAGKVIQRRDLIDEVWGAGSWVAPNTLDVAMRSLRAAVDDDRARPLIRTVRGFGYRIEP